MKNTLVSGLLVVGILGIVSLPADPCGFAFFSDESGVIYQGEALR